jgi:hypothetical protein
MLSGSITPKEKLMSYLPSFGPTSFNISINGHDLNLCIQLVAETNPPDGTYALCVGEPGDDGCSDADVHEVASVTLDEDGNVQKSDFGGSRFSGRNWQSISGVFNTDGTGSGSIADDANPSGIDGVWSAGGGGQPFPQDPDRKHGQHA